MYIASYIYCQGKLLYWLYVVQMPLEFEDLLLPPTYCTLQTVCDQNISLGNWCGTLLKLVDKLCVYIQQELLIVGLAMTMVGVI